MYQLNSKNMKRKTLLLMLLLALFSSGAWAQTAYHSYTATAGTAGNSSSEGYASLVDNKTSTKWCIVQTGNTWSNTAYIEFYSAAPIIPVQYVLTTGNDNASYHGRNPKTWVIKAKVNSGDSWTTIASESNNNTMENVNYTPYTFNCNNSSNTAYKYFRFEVSAIQSGGVFQLSELHFLVGQSAPTWSGSSNYYISNFKVTKGSTTLLENPTSGTAHQNNDYYNTKTITASPGDALSCQITCNGTSSATFGYAMWVDFDGNGLTSSDKVFGTSSYANSPYTGTLTIPANTPPGEYRVRILADFNTSAPSDPCGSYYNGESEDYKLVLTPVTEIYTVTDWEAFCAAVNSGHSYSGQTVTLMNDITTAVTTMAGVTTGESTYNYAFKGTFDGQGHTLTVNLTSGTLSGDWYYTAPFRVIDGATIKNLKTTGTVTQNSGKGAAGLAGYTTGTCTITNCVSNVTINSLTNGDGTHGGFFSEIRGTTTMNNCAFTGSITGSNTNYCGGFVGWKSGTATFNNCVFAPTAITFDYTTGNSANFSRNGGTFNNCYYTQTCGTGWTQGNLMHSITGASGITVANAGTATSYTPETSTIVGYVTGIKFNNILYAANNENVSLNLSGSSYGYHTDNGTLTDSGNPYTLGMTDNNTIIYANTPYTINATANPSDGGIVTGGGQYLGGSSVTVTASANGGYCFNNWTENGTEVSTNSSYTFTVSGNRNLVANFVSLDANSITVSGTSVACGNSTTLTASGLTGVTYNWYSDAACTNLVASGSTYTTPTLTDNITYYVKAVKQSETIQESVFPYTGSAQTYNVPAGAESLKLEVWGAQGGYRSNASKSGKGGYSVGTLKDVTPNQTLYVHVGGAGGNSSSNRNSVNAGGYNGGGYRYGYKGGGGATHIATASGLLKDLSNNKNAVLVVAGGGGSDGATGKQGMYGGGTEGGSSSESFTANSNYCGKGGTQEYSGYSSSYTITTQATSGLNSNTKDYYCGGFGFGGGGVYLNSGYGGAGGGGWYGGSGTVPDGSGDDDRGGGGGSGHVNALLEDAQTIAGNASMPNPNGGTMTGREGNGYARITAYVTEECESAAVAVTVTVNQPAAPTNVTVSNITSNSATVQWNGSASSYSYSIDNGSTWNNTNTASVNLTGLTYGTTYTFQVEAISGNCESSTASTTFTTQDECTLSITGFGNQGLSGRAYYYLIASPMQGSIAATSVTNLTSNTYNFYMFDQTGNNGPTGNATLEWINYIQPNNTHPFTNMVNGTGYLYANINNVTLTFTGTFYNGNGEVTLTRNDNYRFAGWNLVGNPFHVRAYPSKTSFYVMNSTGDRIIAAERNYVEPMEGLFVIANSNNETMSFSTTAPSKMNARLVLNVSKDDTKGNVVDRAIVNFNGGQELPKFQILNKDTKLYVPQESKEYAIVNAEPVGYLPVNFKAEENGRYMLSFVMDEANFNYLHLIDNMTGADIDLLAGASTGSATYTFNAKTTDYESRFKIVFAASDVDGSSTSSETFAFYSNGVWVINNEGDATLQVIDVLGHVLSTDRISGATTKAINAASGIYMLRLINGDNVRVQKIVVR